MTDNQDGAPTPEQELAAKKAVHFSGMTPFTLDIDQVSRVMAMLDAGPNSGIMYEAGTLYVPADLADRVAAINPDDDAPRRRLAAAEVRRSLLRDPIETPHGRSWVDPGTRADIRETIAAIDDGAISAPVAFKLVDGFVTIEREDLVEIAAAIAAHVQAAFEAEAAA